MTKFKKFESKIRKQILNKQETKKVKGGCPTNSNGHGCPPPFGWGSWGQP